MVYGHNPDGFCGDTCRARSKRDVIDGIENIDYIICPVCNIRTKQITPKHAKMHGYNTPTDMQRTLSMPEITCQKKKQKSQGSNNPGYNHGGKFSAWSKHFVNGYDEEKHKKLISDNSYRNKNSPELFKTNIAYWLKQTAGDVELAHQLYMKFQIRDLEWFIDRYGEDEGRIFHQNKINKWMASLNGKSQEELIDINRRKVRKSGTFFSKSEKELFVTLQLEFPEITDQWALCRNVSEEKKKFYLYDMRLNNKIIEYNGDFWHANPNLYDQSFTCPYTNRTFDEIHERDNDKVNTAIRNGYVVLVVWESDYNLDKQGTIEKCKNFLKQ